MKAWDDYAAQKLAAGEADESAEDRDLAEVVKEDSETEGINWAEWETEEESDVEARAYLQLPEMISLLTTKSLQIRRVPARCSPRLGPPEAHRSPHHAC